MKTDAIISALVADQRRAARPMGVSIALAATLGGLISIGLLSATIGVRPDLVAALASWRFGLKLAIVAMALGLALADCIRTSSPLADGFASRWNMLLPALVAVAIAAELILTPQPAWTSSLIGSNAQLCCVAIPALAVAPLVAGILAMQRGAPASPLVAGVAVGRLAAATAGAMYALHCIDDSPLFVATWYALAMLPVIAIGAVSGRFMLRW